MLALAARGWHARRAGQRHRARRLPRPARPALLRPRRPDRCATSSASSRRSASRPTASSPSTRSTTPDAADDRDAARPGGARPRRRARRRARGARRRPRLLAEVELPLVDLLADDGARSASPSTSTTSSRSRRLRRRGQAAARGRRYAVDRQGDQPRLAQAAAGRAVRRARHAQDQAHQDRLHHRRRRAAGALREDRAPVPDRTCCATATWPGCGRPSRACSRRSPTTAASTPRSTRLIAATGRLSSHRPEPAEHPDPHRGGPPDPRGASWSATGYESPDDRRLQPDRDADHGPPLRGRRADRGVPRPARTSTRSPPPGSSASTPTRSTVEHAAPRSRR